MNVDKFITLGRDRLMSDDLDGWLMSEKLDGVRAFWDGHNMWTRGGKIVALPDRIRAKLPTGRRLDGELWAGRGNFEIARVAVQFGKWARRCEFIAFDAPDAEGTWADRLKQAALIYENCVGYDVCQDWKHANALLFDVQAACGEGLVGRHPTATGYVRGRTDTFLKLKEPIL